MMKPKPATKCPRFTPLQRRLMSVLSDGYARVDGYFHKPGDALRQLQRRGLISRVVIPRVDGGRQGLTARGTILWQITEAGLAAWRAYQATGWADTPRSPKTPHHKETNR